MKNKGQQAIERARELMDKWPDEVRHPITADIMTDILALSYAMKRFIEQGDNGPKSINNIKCMAEGLVMLGYEQAKQQFNLPKVD